MSTNDCDFDRLIDDFEAEWRFGRRPMIADYLLHAVSTAARMSLFEKLLPIELEYRLRQGEHPQVKEYSEIESGIDSTWLESRIAEAISEWPSNRPTVLARESEERKRTQEKSRRLGPYKLLQLLGEGGMGAVWMAEQESPIRRRVALKLIRTGRDHRQIIARFEAERQALAMMDHQNIARILDAGSTDDGQPYFVMELVQGIPITEYCDRNKLSIRERLELLIPVCNAVQHAHYKGIVHRDIKPSNVLVAQYDGKPEPKVIDFGLAKALQQHVLLTDRTVFTEFGQVVGTLQYMSPEQAEMNQMDVDARTDIYSLGVILYELLTGSTPIASDTVKKEVLFAILKTIRECDPPPPSVRLSSSGHEKVNGISKQRRAEPSKLVSQLRSELDWMVMKALEKDRTRRYPTANAFAEELQRFLAGEPVTARPPSVGYRLRKFIRKNRVVVAAYSAVLLALAAGMLAFGWQARIAGEQRERADEQRGVAMRQRSRAIVAEASAKTRAEELKLVADFQANMLKQIDSAEAGRGLTTSVVDSLAAKLHASGRPPEECSKLEQTFRDLWTEVNATDAARKMIDHTVLRPSLRAIEKQFSNQPLVDAQLRQTLATIYLKMGYYEDAAPLQERALAIRRRELGEVHLDTLESINEMGSLLYRQGKWTNAEAHFRQVLEACRDIRGAEHPSTLAPMVNLSMLLKDQGNFAEAEKFYLSSLELVRKLRGEDHFETLAIINNYAVFLTDQSRFSEAEARLREALKKSERLFGKEHHATLALMNALGQVLHSQSKLGEAETHLREAFERSRLELGERHPTTIAGAQNLSIALLAQGKTAEAESPARAAYEAQKTTLGSEHQDTLAALNNLAYLLYAQGKLEEAENHFKELLDLRRRVLGGDHPQTISAQNNLGALLQSEGKLTESEMLLREALERLQRIRGSDHLDTMNTMNNLGALLFMQNKLAEAEPLLTESLRARRKMLGEDHANTIDSINNLGSLLLSLGKLSESEQCFREAAAKHQRILGEDHPRLCVSLSNLGRVLLEKEEFEKANGILKSTLDKRRRSLGEVHFDTLESMKDLALALEGLGVHDEAEALLRDAAKKATHTYGNDQQITLTIKTQLARFLAIRRDPEEAVVLSSDLLAKIRSKGRDAQRGQLAEVLTAIGMARCNLAKTGVEFAEAEANLLEAHSLYASIPSPSSKARQNCVRTIIHLYASWDRIEPGQGYDAKREQWTEKTRL